MKEKCYTLIFKDGRGRKTEIASIESLNSSGRAKSDTDILVETLKLIGDFCSKHNTEVYYAHIRNAGNKTIFDVGSHTEFFHLVPAVDLASPAEEEPAM